MASPWEISANHFTPASALNEACRPKRTHHCSYCASKNLLTSAHRKSPLSAERKREREKGLNRWGKVVTTVSEHALQSPPGGSEYNSQIGGHHTHTHTHVLTPSSQWYTGMHVLTHTTLVFNKHHQINPMHVSLESHTLLSILPKLSV